MIPIPNCLHCGQYKPVEGYKYCYYCHKAAYRIIQEVIEKELEK